MKRILIILIVSLSLVAGFLYIALTQASASDPPTIIGLSRNQGPRDKHSDIIITGTGFTTDTIAYFGDDHYLLSVAAESTRTLSGYVPFGLTPGVYTLTVANPLTATLPNAYTVTEGTLGWASAGPYGGMTIRVEVHPTMTDTVFVSANLAGLFRSTDGGENWDIVLPNPVWEARNLQIMPGDDNTIYYGAQDGLYRSEMGDPGTWQQVDFGFGLWSAGVSSLAIGTIEPYPIYCGVYGSLYYSQDGGISWEKRAAGLPRDPDYLAVDHNDPTIAYAAFGHEGTIYKTINAGLQWQKLEYELPTVADKSWISALAADPYQQNMVWIGTAGLGIHISNNGGEDFAEVENFPCPEAGAWIYFIRFDPNMHRIFIGSACGGETIFFRDGITGVWESLITNALPADDMAIPIGNSDMIYVSGSGVWKSIDGGVYFEESSHGITALQPQRIAISPVDPKHALVSPKPSGVYMTTNLGNEWQSCTVNPFETVFYAHSVAFDRLNPSIAYIGGTESLYWSTTPEKCNYWQRLDNYSGCVDPLAITPHPSITGTLYVGGGAGLCRSEDYGVNWETIPLSDTTLSIHRVVFAPSDDQKIYLGTGGIMSEGFGEGIWRSRDGGQNWEHPGWDLPANGVLSLAVHPDNADILLAGIWEGPNDGYGIYRSDDGGDTWQSTEGLIDWDELKVTDIVYDPSDPNIVYAGTHLGLRISFNGGYNWSPYPGSMGSLAITALAIDEVNGENYVYIGTVGGVISLTIENQSALIMDTDLTEVIGGGIYVDRIRWYRQFLPFVIDNGSS